MSQHLVDANNFRHISKVCMPLFETAKRAKSVQAQMAIHQTMVHMIAETLGVEPTAHDLDPFPAHPQRFMTGPSINDATLTIEPDVSGFQRLLEDVTALPKRDMEKGFIFSAGGRL